MEHFPMRVLVTLYVVLVACFSTAAAQPAVIPLEMYMEKIPAFHAKVNGQEGFFLLDTGGGVSVISPEFAKATGCTPWGQVTGFRMTGQRMDFQRCDNLTFDVAGKHLKAPIAGVFDIKTLAPKTAPPLDGSLALDIFAGQVLTLDVSARTLTIETPQTLKTRLSHATEIPARLVRDAEGVALSVDVGVPTASGLAWMEMDSGNDGSFVVANHIAPFFHLQPDGKTPQPLAFTLGGSIPVEGTARTGDLIMDGNLGEQFFLKWAVTFDLKNDRVWVSSAGAR
jgi:hypothetical protein